MTNKTLINTLQKMATTSEDTIEKYIAIEALQYGENPKDFFKDILTHGCISGMISGLVYYTDTHKFFDTYYEEIEELRTEYENSTGISFEIPDSDLKNSLAWFGFEQTAYNLANMLELDI